MELLLMLPKDSIMAMYGVSLREDPQESLMNFLADDHAGVSSTRVKKISYKFYLSLLRLFGN